MKILVLSDSHSSLSFMRRCIEAVKPLAVIHLGDYFDDGTVMKEEYPHIRFYQVPGNCDKYRCPPFVPETLVEKVCGVKLFMTHGHIHRVKAGLGALIRDARSVGAQGVLFGHTHSALCEYEDGLWILNPGSCGYYGGSCAVLEVADNQISDCRILRQSDLD
ncbi:MAG: metallophosphoesterase [Oscillospiraceae bacterium]|nr:metallophosphoesterase [Oscillospiraceae bacterium]